MLVFFELFGVLKSSKSCLFFNGAICYNLSKCLFCSNSIFLGAPMKVAGWPLARATKASFRRNSIFFGVKHPLQYDFTFRIFLLFTF